MSDTQNAAEQRIPVTVKNLYGREETRTIPLTVFRPAGDGPFPLVVFNHGRATVDRRAAQGRYRPEQAARYLVAKGFVVLVPTRGLIVGGGGLHCASQQQPSPRPSGDQP